MSLGSKILCSWISHQNTLFSYAEERISAIMGDGPRRGRQSA